MGGPHYPRILARSPPVGFVEVVIGVRWMLMQSLHLLPEGVEVGMSQELLTSAPGSRVHLEASLWVKNKPLRTCEKIKINIIFINS